METYFQRSIIREDINEFNTLVDMGLDVNRGGCYGDAPIQGVIIKRNLPMIRKLLRNGADPDIQLSGGNYPIFIAITVRSVEMVRELILAGADISCQMTDTYFKDTPLIRAVYKNDVPIIREIIAGGADLNERLSYRPSPLQKAITLGHIDMVRELVWGGAETDVIDLVDYIPTENGNYNERYHKCMDFIMKYRAVMVLIGFFKIVMSKNIACRYRVEPDNLFDPEFSSMRVSKLGIVSHKIMTARIV